MAATLLIYRLVPGETRYNIEKAIYIPNAKPESYKNWEACMLQVTREYGIKALEQLDRAGAKVLAFKD